LPPPPAALLASLGGGTSGSYAPPQIALRYSGPLSGLLDTVTSKAGLSWRFSDGAITLYRFETKTFDIPALAWKTDGENQIAANVGAASSQSASGGSAGGGTTSVGATTITTSSTADVWSDLIDTAKAIASGAQVTASRSTGTITVTGTPDQVKQVSDWVQSIVPVLSRQVALTIQVYAVHIDKEQNYGFTPTIQFENEAKTLGATLTGAPAPTVTGATQPMSFGASILSTATGALGQWSGSQVAVQALATIGNVDQIFSRDLVTLNGQEAPIQVAQQIGYLQSSSTTATTNAGTTSTLTPGTITAGFTGSITPRVVGGKIFLGMNITISSLDSLQTITSGGSSIQLPTTDDSVIQQSAELQSGSTLMITGFQQDQGKVTHNGVGSPYLPIFGGGADATINKVLIAIVVTARTL
jgi:type IVB pilus formation R64 PilN family outer membrane protein